MGKVDFNANNEVRKGFILCSVGAHKEALHAHARRLLGFGVGWGPGVVDRLPNRCFCAQACLS